MLSINKKIILISLVTCVLLFASLAFAVCHTGINAFADELNSNAHITYSGENNRVRKDGFIATYWKTATVNVDYSCPDILQFDLDLYDPKGENDAFWPWENDKYQRHKITLIYRIETGKAHEPNYYHLTLSDECPDNDSGINGTIYWKDGSEPTHFDVDCAPFSKKSELPIGRIDHIVIEANE